MIGFEVNACSSKSLFSCEGRRRLRLISPTEASENFITRITYYGMGFTLIANPLPEFYGTFDAVHPTGIGSGSRRESVALIQQPHRSIPSIAPPFPFPPSVYDRQVRVDTFRNVAWFRES